MRLVYFTHSLLSCWNHGNAHFLRGVLRALEARGWETLAMEPCDGWSEANLRRDHGEKAVAECAAAVADLRRARYARPEEADDAVAGADLVIVHEWTDPAVVARLGRLRARGGGFRLLFHDTHHRAVSRPQEMRALDLSAYDGVLAFCESLAEIWRGWGRAAFAWHEAADLTRFRPAEAEEGRRGLVWIGNWGDGERSEELISMLLRPAEVERLPLTIHGVRYPPEALAALERHGASYAGWAPNHRAPELFARALATVHVPRRFYLDALPGAPTIRVFEALACGLPLVSAWWPDDENLFRPGEDYLVAGDEAEMRAHMRALREDAGLRAALAARGLETVRARHSCDHRAGELEAILARLGAPARGVGEAA